MHREPRRVVTATAPDGRSYVLSDGAAGNRLDQPGRGLTFHEMWATDGPLASNEGTVDAAAGAVVHHPPQGGTRFRIVEFFPDTMHDTDRIADDFAALDASDIVTDPADDPTLHRNDTVDYNIVISGEIYAVTDDDEVLLRPGDTIVQRGTRHTWRNRGTEVCVFASVMVSASPLEPATTPTADDGAELES